MNYIDYSNVDHRGESTEQPQEHESKEHEREDSKVRIDDHDGENATTQTKKKRIDRPPSARDQEKRYLRRQLSKKRSSTVL